MNIGKEIAIEAKKYGLCAEWYRKMLAVTTYKQLAEMYFDGDDWSMEKDFPSLSILRKHKEAIPELTKEWIEKGKETLAEKYHETWEKCVPIRLSDLYEGMELGATLDIVKELNSRCEMETAKAIIEGQGHSGMSFGLVCSMVKSFCDRGAEFANYARS